MRGYAGVSHSPILATTTDNPGQLGLAAAGGGLTCTNSYLAGDIAGGGGLSPQIETKGGLSRSEPAAPLLRLGSACGRAER